MESPDGVNGDGESANQQNLETQGKAAQDSKINRFYKKRMRILMNACNAQKEQ